MAVFSIQLFPVWVLIFSVYAFWVPCFFVALKSAIVPLLMAVMLGMGMTLRWADFRRVRTHWWAIVLGVSSCYRTS
ncbi:bile acid:Na+ symporter, BASS family [Allopseudospirillum japonicum]|uniref:Bile acid:Na+ symporter, BASS family n=1 Tax=Allopseudospirillum japonicum TaxID=64971 RepID=A0A1H6SIA7_9GAMM|nr:hypothetical protein [Allopseudospirillum japonicum]SEI67583.1 bile acid:Na+ symporter, BASS family [Allopseudospirillum japonicum]